MEKMEMIGMRFVASVTIVLHIVVVKHHWQLRMPGLQQIKITIEDDIRRSNSKAYNLQPRVVRVERETMGDPVWSVSANLCSPLALEASSGGDGVVASAEESAQAVDLVLVVDVDAEVVVVGS